LSLLIELPTFINRLLHMFGCVCLLNRKMFIGGLNWQTTPGMYTHTILLDTARKGGSCDALQLEAA